MLKKAIVGRACALALGISPAGAGTIALEGSDAVFLHHDATYGIQLFSYLKSDSYDPSLPVFVFGDVGDMSVPADTVYGLALPGTLLGVYSAVYVQSPFGCCSERELSVADQTDIAAFVAAGGSLAIQDFTGKNIIAAGLAPVPTGAMGGFDIPGGGAGGPSCWDTEVFLPAALSKGFTQPPVLGCWAHQAYDNAYFGPLGFVSLVDSGPAFAGLGSGSWSSFLAKGGKLGTVPEPASLALLGLGLAGFAALRRRAS